MIGLATGIGLALFVAVRVTALLGLAAVIVTLGGRLFRGRQARRIDMALSGDNSAYGGGREGDAHAYDCLADGCAGLRPKDVHFCSQCAGLLPRELIEGLEDARYHGDEARRARLVQMARDLLARRRGAVVTLAQRQSLNSRAIERYNATRRRKQEGR